MSPDDVVGKPIALLLIVEKEERDDEHWVTHGVVSQTADGYVLLRESADPPFPLEEEWFARLKPVTEKLRDIFGAAVAYMPLLVGPLPDDADPTKFVFTGLTIPPQN